MVVRTPGTSRRIPGPGIERASTPDARSWCCGFEGIWRLSRPGLDHLEEVYPELRRLPHVGPHIRKPRGYSPETWRYRIGRWRFFYEIDEQQRIIFMTAGAHRGSAY